MTSENPDAELQELQQFVDDLESKISAKSQMRNELSNWKRQTNDNLRNLDSSIKKNNAFVKKLKVFSATQLTSLLNDMTALNLSKYISEVCSSLSEAKLKMTDVSALLKFCGELYKLYEDFETHLASAWHKILPSKAGEKVTNASKLRVDLRVYADFVSSGIINTKQGLPQLSGVLSNLMQQDKEQGFCNLPIILSFCRHCGDDYAGLIPKRLQLAAEKHDITIPKSKFMHEDKQRCLRTALCDYFKNLSQHLIKEHTALLTAKKKLQYAIDHHGEVSEERQQKFDMLKTNFDKFVVNAKSLADLIGELLPELEEKDESSEQNGVTVSESEQIVLDPWGDLETKSFYTDLPDLRGILPNFSAPKFDPNQAEEPSQLTDEAIEADLDNNAPELEEETLPIVEIVPENNTETALTPPTTENEAKQPTLPTSAKETAPIGNGALTTPLQTNISRSAQFDYFLKHLFDYVNQESMDTAAITFLLQFNIRSNRKRLITTIYNVPRTRLDLLPLLARFVAIINMVQTDVANELADLLRKNLRYHLRRRDQLEIESKIKTVRFIGELTKFGLFKKFDALGALKLLLHNFQHHQVDMVCALFEVAGLYLYNCKDSRCLTESYVEQLWRKKAAAALDPRHVTLVESVYYLIKPPENIQKTVVQRTPMEEFIKHVVFEHLNKQTVNECTLLMRKLHWDKPETLEYAVRCLSKAYLLRYPLISALANLVRKLRPYQPHAVMLVIDNVFEDIRAGLEIHSPVLAQRRMAMAKYLGKLYSYDLVESHQIVNTLYSIITLGVSQEEGVITPLDPPDSLFRIKLACTLLNTAHPFFTRSLQRKRLKYFILFFQSYYWYKKSNPVFSGTQSFDLFPVLVDHTYNEVVSGFDPHFKFCKSYEEAQQVLADAQEKLQKHMQIKDIVDTKSTTKTAESAVCGEQEAEDDDDDDEEDDEDEDDEEDDDDEPSESAQLNEETNEPALPTKTKEDLEFEQLFQQVTAGDLNERSKEPLRRVVKDIPVPMIAGKLYRIPEAAGVSKSSSSTTLLSMATASSVQKNDGGAAQNGSGMPFLLMTRGAKNKTVFKQFVASSDSDMAINFKRQIEEARAENEKVKKLTLNMTERLEEEDDEASLHTLRNTNYITSCRFNRKDKFKHQRGAPDADHIFK